MVPEARLLAFSAALLFVVSSLTGFALLVPLQPWGQGVARRIVNFRSLVSGHVDWMLLAAMQLGAAFAITTLGQPTETWSVWLLIGGGWFNAVPYFLRGLFGVNAMVFAGGVTQRIASGLGLLSATAIVVGWGALLIEWMSS